MVYGVNYPDLYRRAASFVEGAKPVDQPTKFALVINLRTPRRSAWQSRSRYMLGADQVIESANPVSYSGNSWPGRLHRHIRE
jgi:putative tryptophan/tyrosine transport system substrate-binding protein